MSTADALKDPTLQIAHVLRRNDTLVVEPMNLKKQDGIFNSKGEEKFSLVTKEQGKNQYPFKVDGIINSLTANTYHASCLMAKVNATIGLGFLSDNERERGPQALNSSAVPLDVNNTKQLLDAFVNPFYLPSTIDDTLDPLCEYSWHDLLTNVTNDFMRSGNGYIEVARDANDNITNLWWMPFDNCKAYVYANGSWHWVSDGTINYFRDYGEQGTQTIPQFGADVPMAKFGQKNELMASFQQWGMEGIKREDIREVIHFRNPFALHQIYGYPDWLSASAAIELISAMIQYKYEFFLNRGVPEFMLFITGGTLHSEDWAKVTSAVQGQVGQGNSHKSFALNIDLPDIEIEVVKFDVKDDMAFKDKESLQSDIVSAHRVPPLLANILIPGKLGASNEFANSLVTFSTLTISPYQRIFQSTLGRTLGNPMTNGDLGLEQNDCLLRKITDMIDVNKADTMGRMREEVTDTDRDMSEGVKE